MLLLADLRRTTHPMRDHGTSVDACDHMSACRSVRPRGARASRSSRCPLRSSDAGRARGLAVVRCRKTKVVEAEAYPPRYDVITLDPHDTLQKGGAKARDRTTSVTKLKSTEQKSYASHDSSSGGRGQRSTKLLDRAANCAHAH